MADVVEMGVEALLASWWPPPQKLLLLWTVVITEPEQQHQPITSSHNPSTHRALPRDAGRCGGVGGGGGPVVLHFGECRLFASEEQQDTLTRQSA